MHICAGFSKRGASGRHNKLVRKIRDDISIPKEVKGMPIRKAEAERKGNFIEGAGSPKGSVSAAASHGRQRITDQSSRWRMDCLRTTEKLWNCTKLSSNAQIVLLPAREHILESVPLFATVIACHSSRATVASGKASPLTSVTVP